MKKHAFHKTLAALLAVFMLLTVIPFSAGADSPVAQVGETTYTSLADAVNAVNADSGTNALTLTLLSDITLNEAKFTVTRDNVTVDGNGKTLTVTGNVQKDIVLTVKGANDNIKNLKIKSNFGGICHEGTGTSTIENVSVAVDDSVDNKIPLLLITGSSTGALNITIKSCKVRSGKVSSCKFGENSSQAGTSNTITATLEDNDFVNPQQYGKCIDVRSANCKVIVNSGFYQTNSTAVFRVWTGELIVNNGIFYLKGNGSVMIAAEKAEATSGGKMTIKDGVFVSKSAKTGVGCIASLAGTATVQGGTFAMIGSQTPYTAATCGNETIEFPEGSNVLAYNKTLTPNMTSGAAARITTSNGLLFTSEVGKAAADNANALLEAMKAFETETSPATLKYGMLICTEESLTGPGGSQVDFSVKGLSNAVDATYWNVTASENGITKDSSGNIKYSMAITDIPEDMQNTRFCAVSYIMLSAGDVTFYFYSTYSADSNARSIAQVSAAALADSTQSFTSAERAILASTAAN